MRQMLAARSGRRERIYETFGETYGIIYNKVEINENNNSTLIIHYYT